jgi:hypothetical protein
MTTYLIMHSEEGESHRTVDGTVFSSETGREWCQADANARAGEILPLMTWRRSLGRGWGTAAGGGMHKATCAETGTTYYVVTTGELRMTDRTENTAITMANRGM